MDEKENLHYKEKIVTTYRNKFKMSSLYLI